jgi:hypothetical protein
LNWAVALEVAIIGDKSGAMSEDKSVALAITADGDRGIIKVRSVRNALGGTVDEDAILRGLDGYVGEDGHRNWHWDAI